MHVLMLGWEFPPFITGGLGTACFGLTKAMDRRGMQVTFVVPTAIDQAGDSHVRLLAPQSDVHSPSGGTAASDGHDGAEQVTDAMGGTREPTSRETASPTSQSLRKHGDFEHVRFIDVPAAIRSPYEASTAKHRIEGGGSVPDAAGDEVSVRPEGSQARHAALWSPGDVMDEYEAVAAAGHAAPISAGYGGDIVAQVGQYARFVLGATRHLKFDIIHAHDWMTYPAGMLLARITGRPLVAHIHSTEFDRSGEHVNQRIYDIERRGMHSAMRVIAVSQLTKNIAVHRYAVPEQRVEVVYNGVDLEPASVGMTGIRSKDKIVLYFGRITHQKGPEYFVRAAKRVLEVMDNVKFVVAGSGDMAKRMIELAAEMGIGHKVLFTGFLRGADIKRVFNLADLYVMPSVSEPFGIAPLEAMSHNVPALISKSSGVSEVLTHALKVDFWDVDDMANKIVAVLRYPPLSQTLQEHGSFEVRRLTWEGAAQCCEQVYTAVLGEMKTQPATV